MKGTEPHQSQKLIIDNTRQKTTQNPITNKNIFQKNGEINISTDKQILRELISSKLALQEMFKEDRSSLNGSIRRIMPPFFRVTKNFCISGKTYSSQTGLGTH